MTTYENHEENIAAQYIRQCGYTVRARNTRQFGCEIDILAYDSHSDTIYIFEVKKKRSPIGSLFPLISHAQRRRLRRAALALQAQAGKHLNIRVCLLAVDPQSHAVEVIPDIA